MSSDPTYLGVCYKRIAEHFDIAFDAGDWLETGDTVASAVVKCYSGATDVSVTYIGTVTDDNDETVTVELLAAGTAGTYIIVATITTTNADVWEPWIHLQVT